MNSKTFNLAALSRRGTQVVLASLPALSAGLASAATVPVIATANSNLSSYVDANGADGVVAIGADGHFRDVKGFPTNGAVTDWTAVSNDVPGKAGSPTSNGNLYLSADGHIHMAAATAHDVTALASANPAASDSGFTTINVGFGFNRTYYISPDRHIHEIANIAYTYDAWVDTDISVASGAAAALPGTQLSAFGLVSNDITLDAQRVIYPRVYYFSAGGHVQELAWGAGSWHATDISAASGAVPAANGSALGSTVAVDFTFNTNYPRVYYFDNSGNVQELAWGSGWHATNISVQTGAVAPSTVTQLAVTNNNGPRVYYFSYTGHVQELAWGDGWHSTDISQKVGAANAAPTSSMNMSKSGAKLSIYYLSPDNHIHYVKWDGGWSTVDVNGTSSSAGGGGGGGGGGTHMAN